MTLERPWIMQKVNPGDPDIEYTARLVRRYTIGLAYDQGVLDLTAFKVTQRAAGANFTVDVAAGVAVVDGDDVASQGPYVVESTATENKTVTAAPGSNSRYDLVVLQINDPQAGGAAGSDFVITVIAGTPAASPTVPATPGSAIPLASIGPIVPATASITNSLITDLRPLAGRKCTPGTLDAQANTSAAIPNGWLLCAGQAVSRTTYARLFAHLGTTFGAGDGSTTFNLPDMRGRVPVGLDNMGGSDAGRIAAANTLGGTGGAADAIVVAHQHTGPSHQHPIDHDHASVNVVGGTSGTTARQFYSTGPNGIVLAQTGGQDGEDLTVNLPNFTGTSGSGGTGLTGSTGSSATDANLPPYLLVNWIVRT